MGGWPKLERVECWSGGGLVSSIGTEELGKDLDTESSWLLLVVGMVGVFNVEHGGASSIPVMLVVSNSTLDEKSGKSEIDWLES